MGGGNGHVSSIEYRDVSARNQIEPGFRLQEEKRKERVISRQGTNLRDTRNNGIG
jgi:hypothetical protein